MLSMIKIVFGIGSKVDLVKRYKAMSTGDKMKVERVCNGRVL